MKHLHFAFPLAPLAAALILGACTASVGGSITPTPTATPGAAASTPASASPAPTAKPTATPTPKPSGTPVPTVAFKKLEYTQPADDGKPLAVTANKRLKTQAELTAHLDALKVAKTGRPTVDFTKQEVLAFYDKGGPTGCDELVLERLENPGAVINPVFKPKPTGDVACTAVVIPPHYLLVAIDKSSLPVSNIDGPPPPGASPSPTPKP